MRIGPCPRAEVCASRRHVEVSEHTYKEDSTRSVTILQVEMSYWVKCDPGSISAKLCPRHLVVEYSYTVLLKGRMMRNPRKMAAVKPNAVNMATTIESALTWNYQHAS